jgi:hypothetical protein
MANNTIDHHAWNRLELKSEKVRKAIDPIPNSVVIIGYIVILLIIVAIVCAMVFIPYPYGNGESILQHLIS